MKRHLLLPFIVIAVFYASIIEAKADLINAVGSSAISASASVVRGGSGASDGFSNTNMPVTGNAGVITSSYFATAGPVIENPPTQAFPGTAGNAESGAEATVDFTLPTGGIGLEANTLGAILATDAAGINAGYVANNSATARLDFTVDETTTVRLAGTATHSSGAFWQIQLGGGAIVSNYFASATPGTEIIDDLYTFDPGFNYFIRAISDADIGLEDGDVPDSRSSAVSLTFTAIPEPSHVGLLLIGSTFITRHRRRSPLN